MRESRPRGSRAAQVSPTKESTCTRMEALRDALAKQIDYYFSRANLSNDPYLVNQMDAQMFVPIATICNFKLMKTLTEGISVWNYACLSFAFFFRHIEGTNSVQIRASF